mmetsp:Transcript_44935/g.137230  ORF Transcript_44935/g.137230 Transcript_44935/m.137230 type:complete len:111 (-) Transcript_44935:92-424(-)
MRRSGNGGEEQGLSFFFYSWTPSNSPPPVEMILIRWTDTLRLRISPQPASKRRASEKRQEIGSIGTAVSADAEMSEASRPMTERTAFPCGVSPKAPLRNRDLLMDQAMIH